MNILKFSLKPSITCSSYIVHIIHNLLAVFCLKFQIPITLQKFRVIYNVKFY